MSSKVYSSCSSSEDVAKCLRGVPLRTAASACFDTALHVKNNTRFLCLLYKKYLKLHTLERPVLGCTPLPMRVIVESSTFMMFEEDIGGRTGFAGLVEPGDPWPFGDKSAYALYEYSSYSSSAISASSSPSSSFSGSSSLRYVYTSHSDMLPIISSSALHRYCEKLPALEKFPMSPRCIVPFAPCMRALCAHSRATSSMVLSTSALNVSRLASRLKWCALKCEKS
mmetsp:Transcript_2256/g.5575  ORF Transcript_2256/g.5575 Transcript_2256/m.5575 type:complete len:225 (-) Transcript_2256:292-966(-)